ncbi:MAG: rRNA maturation RNase YbeY [Acidobacteriota bacterium]
MKPTAAAMESSLLFQHPSRRVRRTELRMFWLDLAKRVSPGRTASCLITGDEELRRMNRQFRHKDYATDVLSFPTGNEDGMLEENMLGEIAISFDRAAEQAADLGHGVEEELRILMLHGLLHLIGLDHETDAGEMAKAEASWRRKLGLPVGLIERASLEGAKPKRKAATKPKAPGR